MTAEKFTRHKHTIVPVVHCTAKGKYDNLFGVPMASKNLNSPDHGKEERPPNARRYIKIWPDLAQRWGLTRSTAYRLAGRAFPVMRIGQGRLVAISDVEKYERENTGLDGGADD